MPRNISHNLVKIVELLCEGPIEGPPTSSTYSHIYFDDTPLSMLGQDVDIEDLNIELRTGELNQRRLSGVYNNIGSVYPFTNSSPLNSKLRANYHNIASSDPTDPGYGWGDDPTTYTTASIKIRDDADVTSSTLIERIGVTISWPYGLYYTDSNEGTTKAGSSRLEIALCPNPSAASPNWVIRVGEIPGTPVATVPNNDARTQYELGIVSDDSMEPVQRTFFLDIPPSWLEPGGLGYVEETITVRVRCIWGYNSKLFHSQIQAVNVTGYTTNTQTYPYSALAATTLTSDNYSSLPRRSYDLRLLRVKVPSNYYIQINSEGKVTERKYVGTWDGTFKEAWTDNPAWCYYDLITNKRYGLGNYIDASYVDKWELYKIGQYCDAVAPDLADWDIYFQRFNSSGVAQGANILANSTTTAGQIFSDACELGTTDNILAWSSYDTNTKSYGTIFRRFNATGTAQATDTTVAAATTTAHNSLNSVFPLTSGFVVVYTQDNGLTGYPDKVIFKRYNDTGVLQGTAVTVVNATTLSNARTRRVGHAKGVKLSTGDFVIVYEGLSAGVTKIYAKRYNSTGTYQNGVNIYNNGNVNKSAPTTCTYTSGLVVAYEQSATIVNPLKTIRIALLDNTLANPTSIVVDTRTDYSCEAPSLASLSDGGFLVTWTRVLPKSNPIAFSKWICAARYNSSGVLQNTSQIAATSMKQGFEYTITTTGTTNFTAYGATSNAPGTVFIATGAGTGTGQVTGTGVFVANINNITTAKVVGFPSAIGLSGGGYIITWAQLVSITSSTLYDTDVFAHRYNSSDVSQGSPAVVHSASSQVQNFPVAYKNGTGYGITWTHLANASGSNNKVFRIENGDLTTTVSPAVGGVPKAYNNGAKPEYEPRYTCNILLTDRDEAYNVVRTMASIFRGITYFSQNTLITKQDAPQDPTNQSAVVPDFIFNNTNVVDGNFEYSSTSQKTRHSAALIYWNDAEDLYKEKVEYVELQSALDRYGYRPLEIKAAGCTSRGQAHRVGLWALTTENSETDSVTFTTGLEGSVCYPGAIIAIRDSNRSTTRKGGRVVSAPSSSTIKVDAPITITTITNQKLYVQINTPQTETLADGSTRTTIRPSILIKDVVNSTNSEIITITDTWGATSPHAGAVWFLSGDDDTERYYRVMSVEQSSIGTYSVTAIKFNPQKYDLIDAGQYLELETPALSTYRPVRPTSVSLSHELSTVGNNSVDVHLIINWTPDPRATSSQGYRILLKKPTEDGEYSTDYFPNAIYGSTSARVTVKWSILYAENVWQAKVVPTDIYDRTNPLRSVGTESAVYTIVAPTLPPLLTYEGEKTINVNTFPGRNSIRLSLTDGASDLFTKLNWEVWAKQTTNNDRALSTTIGTYTISSINASSSIVQFSNFSKYNFLTASHYASMRDYLDSNSQLTNEQKMAQYRLEVNIGEISSTATSGTTTTTLIDTTINFKSVMLGSVVEALGYTSYIQQRINYNPTTRVFEGVTISPPIPGLTSTTPYTIKAAVYSSPISWTTYSKTLTAAANDGTGEIRITCTNHGLSTGDKVSITGANGTVPINGSWTIKDVTTNTFDLQSSTFSGSGTTTGVITMDNLISVVGGAALTGLTSAKIVRYQAKLVRQNLTTPEYTHTGLPNNTSYTYWVRGTIFNCFSTPWLPSTTGITETTGLPDLTIGYVPAVNDNAFFGSAMGTEGALTPRSWVKSRTAGSLGYLAEAEPWAITLPNSQGAGEVINRCFRKLSDKYIIYVRAKSSGADAGYWNLKIHEKDGELSDGMIGLYESATSNNSSTSEVATRSMILNNNDGVPNQSITTSYTLYSFTYTPTSTAVNISVGIYRASMTTDLHIDYVLVGDAYSTGAPEGTYVAGERAETVAEVTTNYNSSNDNDPSPIGVNVTNKVAPSNVLVNMDSTVNVQTTWEWTGRPSSIDGFIVYLWTSPTANTSWASYSPDWNEAQTSYSYPVNSHKPISNIVGNGSTITITTSTKHGLVAGDKFRIMGIGSTNGVPDPYIGLNQTSTTSQYYTVVSVGTYTITFNNSTTGTYVPTNNGRIISCEYKYQFNNLAANKYYDVWIQPYRRVNSTISQNGIIVLDPV